MIEAMVLAQAITEGAAGAAVGALATVAVVLAKKVRNGNGNGHTNGNGKPCPLHAPLVDQLNEREANRQRDHAETVQEIRDIKTAMMGGFTRLHERIDKMG